MPRQAPARREPFLSGSALKVLATIAMFVDHTAAVLMRDRPVEVLTLMGHTLTAYEMMRAFGRIAFPIFVFLLVEGFLHTSNRRNYSLRLMVFALISELPWNLEHAGTLLLPTSQSVFVTLFLGYVGLCVLERFEEGIAQGRSVRREGMALIGLFLLAANLRADYGASGFAMPLVMYLMRERPILRAVLASSMVGSSRFACLAFIPIAFYNGERGFIRGRALQLLFYAIYPAHMLVLYYLRLRMFGY